MGDIWTGEKLRLRGVEPEDWRHFRELARDLDGVRAAGLVEPPRSDESFRAWTVERAGGRPAVRRSGSSSRTWPTGASPGR
ncbi:hypothetical protein MTP06_36610 [Streptomyces sp. PLM4]|nr:hypothetical protein MTP06_36610 [Streptomyces sp. PLM4]